MPKVWEAQVKAGIVGDNDGIRFVQAIHVEEDRKFNKLAAKGGELYNILAERKCPFYIDRLQGGGYIDEYRYDENLLDEYKKMLGDKFWGFQMHEWISNYRSDILDRLTELPPEEWTKEKIVDFVRKKYPSSKYLYLEAMTAQEFADSGKPKTLADFYRNITNIYKKRMKTGELIPADASLLAYNFEFAVGTKRVMPEVGAQTCNSRLQICYARGMSRKNGRSFGIYYEPWTGYDGTACCYQKDKKNEWGITASTGFPYVATPNGGSSRSLQKRVFLYGYLSGAEFMSEEWGICNVFCDWKDFELSPYGKVKKDFLDFVRKYDDIGDKLSPVAAVLPNDMPVLVNTMTLNDYELLYPDLEWKSFKNVDKHIRASEEVRKLLFTSQLMVGNEKFSLINSEMPDAIDVLNEDESMLAKYDYLIDLTENGELCKKYRVCDKKDVKELLCKILPCNVEGNAHWLINERKGGGYYLTVFNHNGIETSLEFGERAILGAESVVKITFKNDASAELLEGDGKMHCSGEEYYLTIPAGGWAFIRFGA